MTSMRAVVVAGLAAAAVTGLATPAMAAPVKPTAPAPATKTAKPAKPAKTAKAPVTTDQCAAANGRVQRARDGVGTCVGGKDDGHLIKDVSTRRAGGTTTAPARYGSGSSYDDGFPGFRNDDSRDRGRPYADDQRYGSRYDRPSDRGYDRGTDRGVDRSSGTDRGMDRGTDRSSDSDY